MGVGVGRHALPDLAVAYIRRRPRNRHKRPFTLMIGRPRSWPITHAGPARRPGDMEWRTRISVSATKIGSPGIGARPVPEKLTAGLGGRATDSGAPFMHLSRTVTGQGGATRWPQGEIECGPRSPSWFRMLGPHG